VAAGDFAGNPHFFRSRRTAVTMRVNISWENLISNPWNTSPAVTALLPIPTKPDISGTRGISESPI
jgi:hypothetical protein